MSRPNLLRRLLIAVILLGAVAITFPQAFAQTTPADTQSTTPNNATTETTSSVTLFNQAVQSLRSAQLDDARTDLQTILDRNEKDVTQYMAQVLLLQINGSYAQRQSFYLKRRVIDALVLVPDAQSFYAATNYWTDTTCFPILIDDGWYAPIFARAFNPKLIIRWSAPAADSKPRQSESSSAALGSGGSGLDSLIAAHNKSFTTLEPNSPPPTAFAPPPGIVVLDPASPLAPAGFALAKARHQPILEFHSDLKFNQLIDIAQLNTLNEPIMQAAAKFGLLNLAQWSAITLAADLPYRYKIENAKGDFAVDDALGRESHSLRLAVVGRLTGDTTESLYQAMSSLFLQPANILLFDDYSNRKGPFVQYQQDIADTLLSSRYSVTRIAGDQTSAAMFRKVTRVGAGFDMIWLNSSGGSTYFDLRGARGRTDDIPIGRAYSVHAIHSWSVQNFTNPDNLAGRALAGGCYWYFGSISEPYLNAFTEPTFMAERALANTPLAFAARQILPPHPMYKPWKLMLVGDPLFVLRDHPADRTASVSTLPPNYTLVEPTKDITPANFRAAAMLRPDIADALAPRLLSAPHQLDPADLATAMWFADLAGHTQTVADVPIDLALKHPIARALLLRNALTESSTLIASDSPPAAEPYIATVLQLTHDRGQADAIIKTYLAAMAKKNLDDAAVKFLTTQKASPSTTPPAKDAITKALEPPPPPTTPTDQPNK